jgi:hypothetical protein
MTGVFNVTINDAPGVTEEPIPSLVSDSWSPLFASSYPLLL